MAEAAGNGATVGDATGDGATGDGATGDDAPDGSGEYGDAAPGRPAGPGPLARRRFERRPTRLLASGPPSLGALAALPGVARVTTTTETGWTTTVHDTSGLALLRAGVVLGHRCGGPEPGWHLELPAGPRHRVVVPPAAPRARPDEAGSTTRSGAAAATTWACLDGCCADEEGGDEEDEDEGGIRSPARVPAQLRALTRSRDRRAPLLAVARLRTIRREHRLLGADGRPLAVVAADWVSGWQLPATPTTPGEGGEAGTSLGSWHGIEVRHTVEGEPAAAALGEIVDVLATVGAVDGAAPGGTGGYAGGPPNGRPPPHGGHLAGLVQAATLVGNGETGGSGPTGSVSPAGAAGTAGREALAYCHRHVAALVAQDPLVRLDVDDAVHRARVATRRLRSALSTFRPLFDRAVTDPLREELRWLAGELAEARDAEVQRDRLSELVAAVPADLVPAGVSAGAADRVREELRARYEVGLARAVAALDSDRYLALLTGLARFLAEPSLSPRAARGDSELRRLVARSVGRLEEQAAVARAAAGPQARQLAEHEVRKAAKRVRYAAETVAAVAGRPARRLATQAEDVQEALGGRQDAAVTQQVLQELALASGTPPRHAFALGVLAGCLHEQAAEAGAERELRGLRLAADRWPG